MLVYEATRSLACAELPVQTPVAATTGSCLANPPLLVPVLRAGLGMVDQAQRRCRVHACLTSFLSLGADHGCGPLARQAGAHGLLLLG